MQTIRRWVGWLALAVCLTACTQWVKSERGAGSIATFTPIAPLEYYPEGAAGRFEFRFLDDQQQPHNPCAQFPCSLRAVFRDSAPYNWDYSYPATALRFALPDSDQVFALVLRDTQIGGLALRPGEEYQIIAEMIMGWPNCFNLLIQDADGLLFQGYADTRAGGVLSSAQLSPLQVSQRRLDEHFMDGDPCFERIHNTAVTFSLGSESIELHQGQSGELGGYAVALNTAREASSQTTCPDAVADNLAFTLIRLPGAPTPAGLAPPAAGAPLTTGDLARLTVLVRLSAADADPAARISDLHGLEYAVHLVSLDLSGSAVSDLSPLAGLTQLEELKLEHSAVTDLAPLKGLRSLRRLSTGGCPIADLAPLSALTSLEELSLRDARATDFAPLAGLTHLRRLDLYGGRVASLQTFPALPGLQELALASNQISDLSPLAALSGLRSLDLSRNQVSDLSPLAGLVNLEQLTLDDNLVSNLIPLGGLGRLTNLSLRGNQISDPAPLARLVNLSELRLADNRITNPRALIALGGLRVLDLGGNQIEDACPLLDKPGWGQGSWLGLDGNPLSAAGNLDCLQELTKRGVRVDADMRRFQLGPEAEPPPLVITAAPGE